MAAPKGGLETTPSVSYRRWFASPEHRRFLLVEQGLGAAVVDIALNALLDWLVFGHLRRVPVWGSRGVISDIVATAFLLPLITCLIVTWLGRVAVRKGQVSRLAAGALSRAMPRNVWIRALVLALVCCLFLSPIVVLGFWGAGAQSLELRRFLIFKMLFAGLVGALVTPVVALTAISEVEAGHVYLDSLQSPPWTSGPAGRMEWPAMESDPGESIKLGRRWIDPKLFDRAMRPTLGDVRVVKASRERTRLIGLSGSSLGKFRLRLDDGRSMEVVVKASRRGLPQEALFYQRLAPLVPVRVPRLLGTVRSPEGGDERPPVLLLEALSPASGSGALEPGSLRAALCDAARLHARFWNGVGLAEADFLSDAAMSTPEVFRRRFEFGLESVLRRQRLAYFPCLITDATREMLERIASDLEPILQPLRALPQTLLHGDLNPTNLIVLSDSGGVCFIDWQQVCRGPAILDLVHLFHMTRSRGTDRFGRPIFGEPILRWEEFAACYFDALERELGGPVDRTAQIAAAPAADLALTLRFWIPFVGIALHAAGADFLWGKSGWLFQPLLRWAKIDALLDFFLKDPLARLEPDAGAIGLE